MRKQDPVLPLDRGLLPAVVRRPVLDPFCRVLVPLADGAAAATGTTGAYLAALAKAHLADADPPADLRPFLSVLRALFIRYGRRSSARQNRPPRRLCRSALLAERVYDRRPRPNPRQPVFSQKKGPAFCVPAGRGDRRRVNGTAQKKPRLLPSPRFARRPRARRKFHAGADFSKRLCYAVGKKTREAPPCRRKNATSCARAAAARWTRRRRRCTTTSIPGRTTARAAIPAAPRR